MLLTEIPIAVNLYELSPLYTIKSTSYNVCSPHAPVHVHIHNYTCTLYNVCINFTTGRSSPDAASSRWSHCIPGCPPPYLPEGIGNITCTCMFHIIMYVHMAFGKNRDRSKHPLMYKYTCRHELGFMMLMW